MYRLAELVLVTAKTKNNSNEVAITFALGADNPLDNVGISYGDEQDIVFFLHYSTIHIIAVVTNQGNIHYMSRDDDYDYESARRLYNECIDGLDENSSRKDVYDAGLIFLARCSEVGLYYR